MKNTLKLAFAALLLVSTPLVSAQAPQSPEAAAAAAVAAAIEASPENTEALLQQAIESANGDNGFIVEILKAAFKIIPEPLKLRAAQNTITIAPNSIVAVNRLLVQLGILKIDTVITPNNTIQLGLPQGSVPANSSSATGPMTPTS